MLLTRRLLVSSMAMTMCLPSSVFAVVWPPERLTTAARRLRGLVRYPDSAWAIGQLYCTAFPGEANTQALTQLILSSLSLDEVALAETHDSSLRGLLASRVRADFAEERTAKIDGWILSRTEARLCALWA